MMLPCDRCDDHNGFDPDLDIGETKWEPYFMTITNPDGSEVEVTLCPDCAEDISHALFPAVEFVEEEE